MKYILGVFIVLMGTIHSAYSQKGYEIGGWLAAYYFGDLSTNLKIVKPGIAGGIYC